MLKNTASQTMTVFAFQGEGGANPGQAVTGDQANITANLRIDGGAAAATNDVNPTETEDGFYDFDMTQAETNGDVLQLFPASSTANTVVIAVPGVVYPFTTPLTAAEVNTEVDTGIAEALLGTAAGQQSILDAVGAISSGSSSGFNYAVSADNTAGAIIDGVAFVGSQTGTFANTEGNTATFHEIGHVGNAIDLVYRISAGSINIFTAVVLDGYLNSNNDALNVQLYDHVGVDWETVTVVAGKAGAGVDEYAITPLAKHTGLLGTSEAGNLYIRFVATAQTAPNLFIARCIGTAVASEATMGYENGSVWVDEDNGASSGVVQGVDGIFANQSDDFDNAQTIVGSLGSATITIHPGNSITLSQALQGYTVSNIQATLNGGGQNVDSTRINGGFVTGIFARAGTGIPTFFGCQVNAVTCARAAILECGILSTLTLSEAGLYALVRSHAAGPTGIAIIDMAILAATVNIESWSGSLTINNIAAGATVNIHCSAGGDIVINGADGQVNISGVVGSVTDNRTGTPTGLDKSVSRARLESIGGVVTTGTAQAGAVGSITLAASTNYTPAASAIGVGVIPIGGTGFGQPGRFISAWDNVTKIATVTPDWEITPDNTTQYMLLSGVRASETLLPKTDVGAFNGAAALGDGSAGNPIRTVNT